MLNTLFFSRKKLPLPTLRLLSGLCVKCFLLFFIFTCNVEKKQTFPETSEIIGLATPVTLQQGETKILLEDFFRDVNRIDSVASQFLSAKLSDDKKILLLNDEGKEIPKLMELKVWVKNSPYSILLKKSRKINFQFSFDAKGKEFTSAQLAGEFNGWTPKNTEFKNENGIWKTKLNLDKGNYQYQIVADGKWKIDDTNPDSVDNGVGGFNSLLKVGEMNSDSLPKIWTEKFENEKIQIGSKNSVEEYFVFWENFRLDKNFVQTKNEKLFITIPNEATPLSRSHIRIFAYNKFGMSNDLLIPLQNEKLVENISQLTREDRNSSILYFMLADRFKDGDTSNNRPVQDKEVDFKANYQGGDLQGILQKLREKYFSRLDINTIWISPIVQNPLNAEREFPAPHRKYSGYHGYWPISSTEIDFRLGNSETLKALVNEAHSQNINVILDFVSNHIHEQHPLFKNHPDWITPIDLPDGRKNIRLWDEHRLTTWFDTFLPDLDYSKLEVVDMITDYAVWWIKEYKLDGFRHDATKHVPEEFWRTLTRKLKKEIVSSEKRNIYQIGETFGSRELIGSYVNSGELDAQFDFNVYFDARAVFAMENESFIRLKNSLEESFSYYGNHSLMGNITGNHDLPRFISLANGSLKFNEDDKEAGWKRKIENENPIGYKQLKMLEAFVLTIPGIPVIYYGDEIGMAGAGDPDNRRMMKFENFSEEEKDVKTTLEKLTKIRKENMALLYGNFEVLDVSDKTFVFVRSYFNETVLVAFNKNAETKTIRITIPENFVNRKFKESFGAKWSLRNKEMTVTLEPNSFEIFTK